MLLALKTILPEESGKSSHECLRTPQVFTTSVEMILVCRSTLKERP